MPPQTTSIPFTTLSDLVEHALDYLGGTPDNQALRDCLRSVQQSYREVTNSRTWSYLYTHGRIQTDAPYITGTIAYDHEGGTYPRMVTLSGGTWPTTTGAGWQLRCGYVVGEVERQISSTIITLTQDVNFGSDLAAGTPFTLYHDEYLLPSDYVKSDTSVYEGNFGGLTFSDPTDALWWQRFTYSAGTPRFYTITGSRYFPGRVIMRLFPYPDQQKTIDFIYQRRPRDMLTSSLTTGTVSVVSGSVVANANGFTFPSTCQGSIFRLGTSGTPPGSWISPNPPTFETWIYTYTSPTQVQLNDASPVTGSYAYLVSDPIDCEPQSTITAILRGTEKYLQLGRNIQGKPDAFGAFEVALKEAQAADSRSFQGRSMGGIRNRNVPYKYMPANFFPG